MDVLRDAAWEGLAAIITVATVIVGFVIYLFPSVRESFRASLFTNQQRILSLVIIVLVFVFGIFIGIRLTNNNPKNIELDSKNEAGLSDNIPLKLILKFDFEDAISPTNIGAWQPSIGIGNDTLLINTDPSNALSGTKSLQIQSELLSIDDGDWAGVNLKDLPEERIKLAVAWVFIPLNEQTMNREFKGSLYLGATKIYTYSKLTNIKPGQWTPLLVGGINSVTDKNSDEGLKIMWPESDGLVDLQIWHGGIAYSGPIYVDDIQFYAEK